MGLTSADGQKLDFYMYSK